MKVLRVALQSSPQDYDIKISCGLLPRLGNETQRYLRKQGRRIALISNARVFALYGNSAMVSLEKCGFVVSHWLMGDGETHKSFRNLERALAFLSKSGLHRNDAVVALGGGVVGDLAGFAAAVYLRGIALIQVPTTLLAQIDSSVGGKTAVNLPSGKNLVGAFHQPKLVLIDTNTLASLPGRELTAGWCEAVKNGAVSGRTLFQKTRNFLEQLNSDSKSIQPGDFETLISAHIAFKAAIVARDERETLDRIGRFSRRILNFGHTIGHALEAVTHYRYFKHGEAVGHGVLVAGEISKSLGLLSASELELLRDSVRLCGPLPSANLDEQAIIDALSHDKKTVAGSIQWVLLKAIGKPQIVNGREISQKLLRASIRSALHNNT